MWLCPVPIGIWPGQGGEHVTANFVEFGFFPRNSVNKRVAPRCLFVGDRGGGRKVDVLLPL